MTKLKKMILAALVGALTLIGVAVAAPAASAAGCGVLLYQHAYYNGNGACAGTWQPDYTAFTLDDMQDHADGVGRAPSVTANDQVSSIQNRTGYWICVYENTWFWGTRGSLSPWSNYPTLWMNDMISSHRPC